MTGSLKKRSHKAGLSPGSLVHIGEQKTDAVEITLMDYDEKRVEERVIEQAADCQALRDSPAVSWLNIYGLHEVETLKGLGGVFSLHPLVLEDILNTDQRPKIEDHGDYLFIVMKMLFYDESGGVVTEQVSMILGKNYVLCFQERRGDVFKSVRERLRNHQSKLRKAGADYLAYSLVDAVVDNYFVILEKLGERIEELEDEVLSEPTPAALNDVHRLKREMIALRRSVWPLREMIGLLERAESSLIKKATRPYLRDVYDHTIQVIDTVETYRDILAGLLEVYLSSVSNRMNEVMKVLTIIATIFIPLTFVAGVYGMNFENMPELAWPYGYFMILGFMALIAFIMLAFFKRRGWL